MKVPESVVATLGVEAMAATARGALLLEEGDLASAMERLQRAQDRLDEAIRNGADEAEIEQLMQELREALNDYMQELAEEAQRNPDSQLSQNMEGMQMSGDQLQQMLDELQRLMEEGKTAEAQQLIRQMLEADPPARDPWRTYVHADDRFWPRLIARLRAEIGP